MATLPSSKVPDFGNHVKSYFRALHGLPDSRIFVQVQETNMLILAIACGILLASAVSGLFEVLFEMLFPL